MNLYELRRLVGRYAAEEIDYAAFRDEFVRRYLSVWHDDDSLNDLAGKIESACCDFEMEDISVADLNAELCIYRQRCHRFDRSAWA